MDTIFSRIVRGEIPCARVLETDRALAFLDINPVNPGHVLLIPKEAFASLAEVPDDLSAHLASLLPGICRAVKQATHADGLNVIANAGRAAGQTIDHMHWHIIPRFKDDQVNWPWPQGSYSGDGMEQLRSAIEQQLRAGV